MASTYEDDDDDSVWHDGSMRLSRANSATTGSSGYLTATDGSASDSSSHKVRRGESLTPSTSNNSRIMKPGEESTPPKASNSRLAKSGGKESTPSTLVNSRRTKSVDGVTPSTSAAWRRTKSGATTMPSASTPRRTKSLEEAATPTPSTSRRSKPGEVATPSAPASRRTKSDTQQRGTTPTRYASTRIQKLAKHRSQVGGSELEFEIDASKDHWSELSPESVDGPAARHDSKKVQQQSKSGAATNDGKNVKARSCGRVVKEFWGSLRVANRKKDDEDPTSNRAVFESLRNNPQWAKFFEPFRGDGAASASARKMAEGAQAEIYDSAGFTVFKVFKSPHSLRDLHKQWPHGMLLKGKQIYSMAHALGLDIPVSISEMLPSISSGAYFHELNTAGSFGGVLLDDGRFALVMKKYDGDLRTLIDARMLQNGNQGPPFGYEMAKWMMRQIAVGMNGLHRDRIVHRDLKASNVLYEVSGVQGIDLAVADFECSARVLGTGFWRAPEILKALPDVPAHAFSEKSDVYSYAMTCYEILTGCLPFENQLTSEVGVVVLDGQRPELPAYVEPSVRDLIASCWHEIPAKRPAFGVILKKWRDICV